MTVLARVRRWLNSRPLEPAPIELLPDVVGIVRAHPRVQVTRRGRIAQDADGRERRKGAGR